MDPAMAVDIEGHTQSRARITVTVTVTVTVTGQNSHAGVILMRGCHSVTVLIDRGAQQQGLCQSTQ